MHVATIILTSTATIVSNFGNILCHGNRLSIEDNNNFVPSNLVHVFTHKNIKLIGSISVPWEHSILTKYC